MGGKYLLYIMNKIINMLDPLKDLIYTYKYRKFISLIWTIIYSRWRDMTIYYIFKTYIVKDYLGLSIKV